MLLVFQGAILGIGATLLFDIWGQVLARLPGQRQPDWTPVGRWFRHLAGGVVFHDDIAAATAHPGDETLGWAAHYAVGIVYGIVFALIVGEGWMAEPRPLPAFVFAIATIAFGWFLLQPGMGLGWAAARTPNPTRARLLGLVAHSVFGLGLYATAMLIR